MQSTIGLFLAGLFLASALVGCDGASGPKPGPAPSTPQAPAVPKTRAAIDEAIQKLAIDRNAPGWKTRLPRPPSVRFDPNERVIWELDVEGTRGKGTMRIELFADRTPEHVGSFVYLTKLGFFDGLNFHRIMSGFMAQGGCPLGTGGGSPGYQIDGEIDPAVNKHDRVGILSAANAGPGTDGSQFFLTFGPTPHLNGGHTVFGQLIEGEKTLWGLANYADPTGVSDRPTEPPVIKAARIVFEPKAP